MGKYVIISPFFPSENNFRGAFVYDFAQSVIRSGKYDDVLVFVPKHIHCKKDYYFYKGIKVHLFPVREMPSYLFNGILNRYNQKLFIKTFHKFGFDIHEIAVAHSHTSTFGAMALALQSLNPQIKTILHHHDPDPYTLRNGKFAGNWLNLWIRAKINLKLFSKIDIHVCISEYVKSNLCNFPIANSFETLQTYTRRLATARRLRLKKPDLKQVYVLYNGVDLRQFHPVKSSDISSHKAYVIGCIGNFVDWKDQITLLKAINELKGTELYDHLEVELIGTGPCLADCKTYITQHHLENRIKFSPEVDHSELPKFFSELDLFVLPSYFEGFGCVFLEAAACGIPFMGVYNQGYSEYLSPEEQSKWLIRPHDYKHLAHLILQQYSGKNIQEYIHPIDIDELINDFLDQL